MARIARRAHRRRGAREHRRRLGCSVPRRPLPGARIGVMREKVEQTIEAIRPAIQADGGDIQLQDVDEATGVVTIELVGACVSCPASTVTLKAGIERILKDRVEGVTSVINQGEDLFEGTPLSL